MLSSRLYAMMLWAAASLILAPGLRAADAPAAAKPLLVLTGADSKAEQAGFFRAESADELKAHWLAHLGLKAEEAFRQRSPVLDVDFDRCMVVVLFQGRKTNSRGLDVLGLEESDSALTLRYDDRSFQTAGGVVNVVPFAFVVLPKTNKPVVVEENVQNLKNQPPKWKERAKLAANER